MDWSGRTKLAVSVAGQCHMGPVASGQLACCWSGSWPTTDSQTSDLQKRNENWQMKQTYWRNVFANNRDLQGCTQGEQEQQQTEAGEVQCGLLVDLSHCVKRDTEQQHASRECWTAQERQQDGAHYKVACMCNTRPHGFQTQAWNHKQETNLRFC